jgi:hypothetical protein
MEEKHCTRCDATKPLSEFGMKNAATGKLKAVCKPCSNQIATKWKADNKEKEVQHREPQFKFDLILKTFLRKHARRPNKRGHLQTISAYPQAGVDDAGIIIESRPRERVTNPLFGHPMVIPQIDWASHPKTLETSE